MIDRGRTAVAKSARPPKLPSPLPRSRVTTFASAQATARSGLPSRSKSAKATLAGPDAVANAARGCSVPSPLPRRTDTVLLSEIGHDDVGVAIAVEVSYRDAVRPRSGRVIDSWGECAVSIAQEHGDG